MYEPKQTEIPVSKWRLSAMNLGLKTCLPSSVRPTVYTPSVQPCGTSSAEQSQHESGYARWLAETSWPAKHLEALCASCSCHKRVPATHRPQSCSVKQTTNTVYIYIIAYNDSRPLVGLQEVQSNQLPHRFPSAHCLSAI